MTRAAHHYLSLLPSIRRTSSDPRIVVAIFGVAGVEYVGNYLALQRLGLTCSPHGCRWDGTFIALGVSKPRGIVAETVLKRTRAPASPSPWDTHTGALVSEVRQQSLIAVPIFHTFGLYECPRDLGKMLVDEGVKMANHYGTTETGLLMQYAEEGWDWPKMFPVAEKYAKWELEGDGIYQLVMLSGWPGLAARNREDGSYATKDLFETPKELEDVRMF